MNREFLSRCLLAVCLVLATGCSRNANQTQPPPTKVRVDTAMIRTVKPILKLAGIIAPLQNVALSTSLQEPADAVYVNEGDSVRRGQLLAQLNTADLNASLSQAQAHLEQTRYQAGLALHQGNDQVLAAQAALAQAKANLELANANLARDEQLLAQGYVSIQTVDQQRTQAIIDQKSVMSAQASLSQAKENVQANGTPNQGLQQANVDQAAAAVSQIEAQIARASISSPVDGVVVNRNINPGEYPGVRQIFTLQEVARVYAELNAYGDQVAGIRQGSGVSLAASALPHRSFAGSVNAVLSPATPTTSGFIVKVVISNPKAVLRPGMTVSANVRLPAQNGIAVPTSAFVDDTHQTVIVVDGDTAHIARVTEVIQDAHYAIVTGLPAQSKVVVNGQSNVTDGQKVVAAR